MVEVTKKLKLVAEQSYIPNMEKGATIAEAICLSGLEKLKDTQMDAIHSFLDGNDVFVSLPTGYGKSVIYGILPTI